ncbi:glutamate receptor ionotropic, NMDA 1-like isoform X1 [Dendronephthya gigantea]|uniref:glutamate receptor ionotropic, NMDA 1-like isoform X1 n=1 Tax=Dendronephthya gigantea TaxID=151771 RepID=UPI00106C7C68|nr:glutamate receptor ionotropic, NMDA 1-like isoform X1 [Dendronephthya gigantea]
MNVLGASYKETTDEFCRILKNTGVSAIVSLNISSHPKHIDIYASYIGIPVIKLFNNPFKQDVVKQDQSTQIHLGPDRVSRLMVITEILKHLKRNDRVVVISNENQSTWAKKLVAGIRKTRNSVNDVILNLTITKNEDNYFRTLSIIQTLNVKAVVILMEENIALDFMDVAQQVGFLDIDCIWIVEHSLHGRKRIPLLGKLLGVRLAREPFSNDRSQWRCEALFNDSIKILSKAFQNVSNAEFEMTSPSNSCTSTSHWLLGTSLYRFMKLVRIEGDTGWIEFDGQGYRTNVEYEIDYFYKEENGTTSKIILGQYHNKQLNIFHTDWPPEQKKLDLLATKLAENLPFRVSVLLQNPFVRIEGNSAHNSSDDTCALGLPCVQLDGKKSCCSGYCIDLLKLLMRDIGFSVRIHIVKDGKYGGLDQTTGQWSGLIGEVSRGEADMAVSDLTITEQRSKVVDFTHPYMDAGMAVMVKVSRRERNDWTDFMDPFAASLWIAIIVCINITLLIMWLLERYSPYGQRERAKFLERGKEHSFNFVEAIWYTWSLVYPTDIGSKPKSFSCRVLALSFTFSMLIVVTSYTANLAAFLVIKEEILPLNDAGIRDPKLQNPPSGFRIATVDDSSLERSFQVTEDPVLRRVWKYMKPNNVKHFDDAIKQLNSKTLQAFVWDYSTLTNFAAKSHDCSFKILGNSFFDAGFGVAVRKNSSLTSKISQALLQYETFDTSRTLRHRWLMGQCSATNRGENAMFSGLSIGDLRGLFLAICIGAVISFLFLTSQYFKNAISRSLSRCIFC